MSKPQVVENMGEAFPGGGYYINKELGAVMPCKPEQGLPNDTQAKVMQKIDILAQELEHLMSFMYDSTGTTVVNEVKDAIKELNGQTILLLKLFCMDSHVIDRGNNDDEEGRREERRNDGADQG